MVFKPFWPWQPEDRPRGWGTGPAGVCKRMPAVWSEYQAMRARQAPADVVEPDLCLEDAVNVGSDSRAAPAP